MATNNNPRRAWCLTIYNEDDAHRLQSMPGIKALVIGKEVCSKTGRDHWQTYVRFDTGVRFSWFKNQFPTVHVEPREGTEYEAAKYCRKDGNVLVDFGCAGPVPKAGDQHTRAGTMCSQGCPPWQIHREMGPKYWLLHGRKVKDYCEDVSCWKQMGHEYEPDYKSDEED